MLFKRRPSLSQQPAGSQVVMTPGRGIASGGCGASMAGEGAGAGRAAMAGAGTLCGGWGAPERCRLPLSAPRHAAVACRRARASRAVRVVAGSLSALSSSARASTHSAELIGSGSRDCAGVVVAAAAVSSKTIIRRMALHAGSVLSPDPCQTGRPAYLVGPCAQRKK